MPDKFPHQAEYTNLWANMDINPRDLDRFQAAAKKIIAGKVVYQNLESQTNVPWYLIGVIHYRESDCDFKTHLHNGDPLSARTKHVPAGRPLGGHAPFSFEYSAIDALTLDGLTGIDDWSIERCAYSLEKFNGFGYRQYHVNSPYLWAGTDDYTKGKYVRDGVFSYNVVDKQLGAMGIIKVILDMEPESQSLAVWDSDNANISVKASPPATPGDLTGSSRGFKILNTLHNGAKATVATAGAVIASTDIPTLKSYGDTIKEGFMTYGPWAIILVGAGVWYLAKQAKQHKIDDINAGRYIPSGNAKG